MKNDKHAAGEPRNRGCTEQRVAGAIAKLGEELEPPADWQDRVHAATSAERPRVQPATMAGIEAPVEIAEALGNIQAVVELVLLACNQDSNKAIGSLVGAVVAIAAVSSERVQILEVAELALATARKRWQRNANAVPS